MQSLTRRIKWSKTPQTPSAPSQSPRGTPQAPLQTRSIIPDKPSQFDNFLGVLSPALATLKGISDLPGIPVPALKGAADIALTLVELLRTYRANQTGSEELVYHAVYLTAAICDDCPKQPNEKVNSAIEAFKNELEVIKDKVEKISSKNSVWAFVNARTNADWIKAFRDSLNMAYKKFLLSLNLEMVAVLSRMEEQASHIERATQDLKHDSARIIDIASDIRYAVKDLSAHWMFTRSGRYVLLTVVVMLIWLVINANQTTSWTKEAVVRIDSHAAEGETIARHIKEESKGIKRDTEDIKEDTGEIRRFLLGKEYIFSTSLPSVAIPSKPEIFYGREKYVETIVDHILRPKSRVAILGPGGMGKTSIALAVMHDPSIRNTFNPDHLHWVPCEKATTPEFLVELLAKSTNAAKLPGPSSDRLKDVVNTLQVSDRRHLIVLDNLETLINIEDRRPESENILHAIALPNVNILTTMRGALPPSTRLRWVSPPLEALSLDAARQTFVTIYPEAKSDDQLDKLLLALDCVPLAVDLMASVGGLGETPTELLERWKEERTPLLHIAPDRLHSVDHSIKISLESSPMRKNPEASRLLAILSMLPGGTQRHFIEEIAPSIKGLRASQRVLSQVSLTSKRSNNDTIHVLSPIRSYMLHHHPLDPQGREDIYNAYYAMAKRGDCFGEPEFGDAVLELSKEAANLESVLLDALQHGDLRAAIEASLQYSEHLHFTTPRITVVSAAIARVKNSGDLLLHARCVQKRGDMYGKLGYYTEALSDLQTARELFQQTGSPLGVAQSLRSLGSTLSMQGQYDKARSALKMARDQFQQIGQPLGVAQCLQSLGDIHFRQSQYDEAWSAFQTARDQFQQMGDRLGAAQCLKSLGYIHRMQGQLDEARSALQTALDQFQQIGSRLGAAQCLRSLGEIHGMQGQYHEAQSALQTARDQFQQIGERHGAAQCLRSLGDAHRMQGRYDEARSALQTAQAQFQQIGSRLGAAQCLRSLGDNHRMQGQYDEARSALQTARDQFQQIGDRLGEAQCLKSLGDIHFRQGQYDKARSALQAARDLYQQIKDRLGVAQCLQSLGDIHGMQGRYDEARSAFQTARDLFQQNGLPLDAAQCLRSLGDIHRMQGQYDKARSSLQAARDQFQRGGEPRGAAQCLLRLGDIHRLQGQYDEARSTLQTAQDQFQLLGDRLGAAQCLQILGNVHGMQGQYDEARSALETARDLFQQIGERFGEAQCIKLLEFIATK